MTLNLLWQYKHWIAIVVFFFLWVGQIAYTNHLSGKIKKADILCSDRIAKLEKQHRDAMDQQQADAIEASEDYEADKAELQTKTEYIIKEVDRIVYRDVYRNNCSDDAGRGLLNEAIHHANSSGKS